jgi:hypothetical protein
VFLDTNVLVSAFASRGLCADLLELVLLEHDLILGRNVLRELDKALRETVRLSTGHAAEIAELIRDYIGSLPNSCRRTSDDRRLSTTPSLARVGNGRHALGTASIGA